MRAHLLNDRFVLGRLFDVIEERNIVAGAGSSEVPAQRIQYGRRRKNRYGLFISVNSERAVRDQHGLLVQLAFAGKLLQQFFRRILGLLHVWLIEGIDAEAPPGKCSRDLPKEKFFTEIVEVCERAVDHRVARSLERLELHLSFAVEL